MGLANLVASTQRDGQSVSSVLDEVCIITSKYCDLVGATYGLAEPYFIAAYLAGVAAPREKLTRQKHPGHPDQSVHGRRNGEGRANRERARKFGKEERQMESWGRENFGDWSADLSDKQFNTVQQYTSALYHGINSDLRNENMSKLRESNYVRPIDEALDKAQFPEDVMVYRGIDAGVLPENPEEIVGTTLTDKGFVSTSLDVRDAQFFAGAYGDDEAPSYVIEIFAPKGSKGAYIGNISLNKGENEVLLPRNSKFTITGYRTERGRGGAMYNVLEAEYVGQSR